MQLPGGKGCPSAGHVKRGEIWTIAAGPDCTGKPRPAVILQDDRFDMTASVTVCAFTTNVAEAPLFRLPVTPSELNGLRLACRIMVDKVMTVPKVKLGARLGRLSEEDIIRLNRAIVVFLGIGASAAS